MDYTLKIDYINDKQLFHYHFESQREMNKIFCRFSEFIESPTLKGTWFSLADILDIEPNYYNIFSGHNIPGDKLSNFLEVVPYLSYEEDIIIQSIGKENLKNKYVIATCGDSRNALHHEIAHAFYYLNGNYREHINYFLLKIYADINYKPIENILAYYKYNEDVYLDEIHAHLLDLGMGYKDFFYGDDLKEFFQRLLKFKIYPHFIYNRVASEIAYTYKRYYKEFINEKEND